MNKCGIDDNAAKARLTGCCGKCLGADSRHADIGGHALQMIAVWAAAHRSIVGRVAVARVNDYRAAQGIAQALQPL